MILNVIISACILWVLIIVFDEARNHKYAQQKAITIVLITVIAGFLFWLFLPPFLWPLTSIGQAGVLYLAVGKICENSQRTTIKIVICYFVITFSMSFLWRLMTESDSQTAGMRNSPPIETMNG